VLTTTPILPLQVANSGRILRRLNQYTEAINRDLILKMDRAGVHQNHAPLGEPREGLGRLSGGLDGVLDEMRQRGRASIDEMRVSAKRVNEKVSHFVQGVAAKMRPA